MATPRRRISDYGPVDADSGDAGTECGFIRSGSNPRALGLSATADLGVGHDTGSAGVQSEENDIAILSDLIAGPAGDVAPLLSRELIDRHGSLMGVLMTVKTSELSATEMSDDVRHRLEYFAGAMGAVWRQEVLTAPILAKSQTLAKYLQFEMASLKRETFRVLFLDAANRLLLDRVMWEGSVNRVQVHPREVVSLALKTHASALILVHNHPSGRAKPSQEDVRLTQQTVAACKLLDIAVHDHLIVARQHVFSMRSDQSLIFSE